MVEAFCAVWARQGVGGAPRPMRGTSHPRQTWPHEETTKHRLRGAGGWELWTRLWEQMDEVGGLQQEGVCGKVSRARGCP